MKKNRLRIGRALALLVFVAAWQPAQAAVGDPDPDFGNQGIAALTRVPLAITRGDSGQLYLLTALGDGQAVPGGPPQYAVLRYSADGAPDNGFGSGGQLILDAGVPGYIDLAVDEAQQKLVLVGTGPALRAIVTRIGFDGIPDATFGVQGTATLPSGSYEAQTVELLPNGKIMAAGTGFVSGNSLSLFVARLKSDGALDTGFGDGGVSSVLPVNGTDGVVSMSLDASGRITLCGPYAARTGTPGVDIDPSGIIITRLQASGAPDTGFGVQGTREVDLDFRASCLWVRAHDDGGFSALALLGGTLTVARFHADGTLDPAFDDDGKQSGTVDASLLPHIAVRDDGKLIVGGIAGSGPALMRLQGSPEFARDDSTGGDSGDGGGALGWPMLAALAALGLAGLGRRARRTQT